MSRIYLDTCVIIYAVEGTQQQQVLIHELFAGPERQFVVSELGRLECRVQPLRAGNGGLLSKYERFFAPPQFEVWPMDRAVFDQAAELRATLKLKTPDALHAAVAIHARCDELWTNDRGLLKLQPRLKVVVFS